MSAAGDAEESSGCLVHDRENRDMIVAINTITRAATLGMTWLKETAIRK